MIPQYIAVLSVFITLTAISFYVRDILRGTTKPNLVSWFMWFLAPVVAAGVSFSEGAGISALPVFMAGFGPIVVLLVAIRNKNYYWRLGIVDYACLALSLLALLSWVLFRASVWATVLAVLADGIAFIPTYIKSWQNPNTETLAPYFSGSINSSISILTLPLVFFVTAGFAVYLIFGNLIEIGILLLRRNLHKKWPKTEENLSS